MARLYSTGFELQSVTSGVEWDTTTTSPTIDTSLKRSGAASLKANPTATTAYITHTFNSNTSTTSTFYLRFYVYITSATDALDSILVVRGSSTGVSIRMNSNATLELWDDAGATQLGSDSSPLSVGIWYRVEISIANASGLIGVTTAYIDGSQFATGTPAATSTPTYFRLGACTATTCDLNFDDVAANDSSGSYQTGLPGDGSIAHLYPVGAGDVDETDLSPNGYTAVDDKPTPSDAEYVVFADDNDDFLVTCESCATGGIVPNSITLVQVGYRHRDSSATGSTAFTPQIESQSSGTKATGSGLGDPGTTWRTNGGATPRIYPLTSYVDPQNGGAWTTALLNAAQIGGQCTDASPDLWISSMWMLVEYIPTTFTKNNAVIARISATSSQNNSVIANTISAWYAHTNSVVANLWTSIRYVKNSVKADIVSTIDQNKAKANISPAWISNFTSSSSSNVSNPNNVKADDGAYATFGSSSSLSGANYGQKYIGEVVDGIEVLVHAWSDNASANNYYEVYLSSDGGSNWTTAKRVPLSGGIGLSEQQVISGSPTDLWGRAWTVAQLDIAQQNLFKVKVAYFFDAGSAGSVEYIAWRAYTSYSSGPWTITKNIEADLDDGTELWDITTNASAGYTATGYSDDLAGVFTNGDAYEGHIGLDFKNLDIPQGAIITSAIIKVYSWSTHNYTAYLKILGINADNFSGFLNSAGYKPTDQLVNATTSKVDWDLTTSDTWTDTLTYATPSIVSIVQEIVNRDGWVAGNNMSFIIHDDGGSAALDQYRDTYDFGAGYHSVLLLNYSIASANYAIANIVSSGTLTQLNSVIARIRVNDNTQVNSIKATICVNNNTDINSAKASIKTTPTQVNNNIANIKLTTTKTNSSIADIKVTNSDACYSKSNIRFNNNTQLVSSKATIRVNDNSDTNSTKANIRVNNNTQAQNVIARLFNQNITKVCTSKGWIVQTYTDANTVKGSISIINTNINSCKSNILLTTTKQNNVEANIQTIGQQVNSSKANILLTNTYLDSVIACIYQTRLNTNTVISNIRVNNNTNQNSVKAAIFITQTDANSIKSNILGTLTKTTYSIGALQLTGSDANYSKANILYQNNTKGNNSKANIKLTNTYLDSSKANILLIGNVDNNTIKANILSTITKQNEAIANIKSAGQVTNLSKANIIAQNFYVNSAKGNISETFTNQNSVLSNIRVNNNVLSNNAKAAIYITPTDLSIVKSNILGTQTKVCYTIGALQLTGSNATYSKANILYQNNTKANSCKANIKLTNTGSNSSKSNILRTNNAVDNVNKANILTTYTQFSYVRASIFITPTDQNQVKSNILYTTTKDNKAIGAIWLLGSQAEYVRGNIRQNNNIDNNEVKASITLTFINQNSVKARICGYVSNQVIARISQIDTILENKAKLNVITTYYCGCTWDWNPSYLEGANRGYQG